MLSLLFLKHTNQQGRFRFAVTVFAITLATTIILSVLALSEAISRGQTRGKIFEAPFDNTYRSQKIVNMNADELVMRFYYSELDDPRQPDIAELSLRQLTPNAPLLPGMTRAPQPNEVFVSKALGKLIRQKPEIAERFKDLKIVENISDNLLPSPDSLQAISYLSQEAIDNNPKLNLAFMTKEQIENYKPATNTKVDFIARTFMLLCGLGLIFPLLVLISSATRIGALQRQHRYAALSLIGTSKKQINRIILTESLLAGGLGVALGSLLYVIVRPPVLGSLKLANGSGRYFLEDIVVTPAVFWALIIIILLLIVSVNWWAMRKVKTSPLGVIKNQKITKRPSILRLLPLAITISVLTYIKSLGGPTWTNQHSETFMFIIAGCFLLAMFGLVLAGSYLTYIFSLAFGRLARRPIGLMSSRRLKVFAKPIFASVSGVVLAIFVGSFFITSIESVKLTTKKLFDEPQQSKTKSNVPQREYSIQIYSYSYDSSIDFSTLRTELLKDNRLDRLVANSYINRLHINQSGDNLYVPFGNVYNCADLKKFTNATCPNGSKDNDSVVLVDNLNPDNQQITQTVIPISQDVANRAKADSLKLFFNDSNSLQKATQLINNFLINARRISSNQFHLTINDPNYDNNMMLSYLDNFKNLIDMIQIGTIATIVIGGVSLAVSTIGGFFERQKSFANLRLMGAEIKTLNAVVLIEATVPLLLASILALLSGIGFSQHTLTLIVKNSYLALPQPIYFIMVALSLITSLAIIVAILPILKRLTSLEENRTE